MEVVRVYLRVEDLPPGRGMIATVERSVRSPVVSRFFEEQVRADGGGEVRLSASENEDYRLNAPNETLP